MVVTVVKLGVLVETLELGVLVLVVVVVLGVLVLVVVVLGVLVVVVVVLGVLVLIVVVLGVLVMVVVDTLGVLVMVVVLTDEGLVHTGGSAAGEMLGMGWGVGGLGLKWGLTNDDTDEGVEIEAYTVIGAGCLCDELTDTTEGWTFMVEGTDVVDGVGKAIGGNSGC
jgi:hypothetical protein